MKKIFLSAIWIIFSLSLSACDIQTSTNIQNTSTTNQTVSTKPYEIWSVDTAFQRIWPDHQIEVGAVPDPKVNGVTCFYSRAKKWWIAGGLWFAEDTSDASVACRQTWPMSFAKPIAEQEEIWNESTSIFFKKLRIVRFYDKASNSLIYLVYSDKLIDGSPKNSISAVALENVQALIK